MKQIFIQTAAADLLGKAAQYKKDGYRMVQILCTRVPEGYELTYSFDKDYVMENLRVVVPLEGSVMKPMPWHELANAKQPAAAVKVNLRPGLGVDAAVKPAAKPAAPAAKPAEGGN